ARDDIPARRVDPPVGVPALGGVGSVGGEGDDPAAFDEYVGVDLVGRGDDQTTVDDGTAHGSLLNSGRFTGPWAYGRGGPVRFVYVRGRRARVSPPRAGRPRGSPRPPRPRRRSGSAAGRCGARWWCGRRPCR